MRVLFVVAALGLAACAGPKTLKPSALPSLQEQIDQGLPVPPVKPLPSVLSQIDVPVSVELKPYFDLANQSLDQHLEGGESPCQGLRYQWKLDRGALAFSGSKQTLFTTVPVSYGLKGEYCAACLMGQCALPPVAFSCGWNEAARRAKLSLKSDLSISPDYRLISKTSLLELKPLDPCKVSFGIDITQQLIKTVTPMMGELCGAIDASVADFKLKPYVHDLWNLVAEPMDIEYVGQLRLQPKAVSVSALQLDGSRLSFRVGMSAQPIITSSGSPATPSPLPNLSAYKKGNGFQVFTDLKLNYDSLSAQVLSYMKDEVFAYGRDSLHLSGLRLFPTWQDSVVRLGIQVDVNGTKSGSLYLVGDPSFDPEKKIVRLTRVDYDLNTRNLLVKSASWLLDETVRKNIEENLWFEVGDLFTLTEENLLEALNQRYENGAVSKGTVQSIELTNWQLRPKTLWLRVRISGELSISM